MAALEEPRPYTSSTEQIDLSSLRARHVPDVPEDIDFLMEHLNDPNYDLNKSRPPSFASVEKGTKKAKSAYDHSEVDTESHFESDRYSTSRAESRNSTAIDFDDESPYPEVRAAVSSVDDPSMPVNTFRMWFLGIIFVLLTSGLNQIFALRYPSIFVTGIVAQLISLPFGRGLAIILPTKRFNTFGYVWSFNPGPFTIKEHVCITVMANVVVGGAYSTEVILTQRIFYGQTVPMSYQMLLALGSQILGFSLGGLLRQFVVWPSSMIWPGALVNSALFNTLHKNYGKRDRGHITRERFFCIAMACSFVWYWIPGYLFTALSMFNWVCWIAPNNVVVNALFGTNTGLGMSILTFDWGMIAFIGSPLVTPWWSQMNTGVAFVIMFWLVAPILYFSNVWNSAYFPISAYITWDNTGAPYQAKAIITDGIFDPVKYAAYSPVFMSTTLALAYGIAFAAFPAVFVHTFLWFRKDIVRRFRNSLKDERDVHSRLMQYYPEVPMWWYGIVGAIAFAFFCTAIEIVPTQLPIWAAVIGIILAAILAIPLAMLQAITNQQVPTQVMHELIAGYMLPGRPIANVIFKTIAFITTNQAINFAGDLKLGHYMKVPPRIMFSVQVVAAAIACVWVTVVQDWMLSNIEDICTPGQKQGFRCPGSTTFATASVIWGGVGPSRLFSPGAPYSGLLWFFPVGILAPIPFYLLARRFPLSFWRYINIPVFFAGLGAMPPASGINYISWVMWGFIFNYCIRRFHFRWWMRYNYILSAALDAGVAVSMVVIFFALQLAKGGIEVIWWGNTVWMETADANGMPFKPLPESGFVGPASWS
ncbi:OPT oligopeptide transporter [Crassisporium funariophilum]|nr:OPT oligopeptide transporter [Crassisporium funariophilum]